MRQVLSGEAAAMGDQSGSCTELVAERIRPTYIEPNRAGRLRPDPWPISMELSVRPEHSQQQPIPTPFRAQRVVGTAQRLPDISRSWSGRSPLAAPGQRRSRSLFAESRIDTAEPY